MYLTVYLGNIVINIIPTKMFWVMKNMMLRVWFESLGKNKTRTGFWKYGLRCNILKLIPYGERESVFPGKLSSELGSCGMTWEWVPRGCLTGAREAGSLEVPTAWTEENLQEHLQSPGKRMKAGGLAGLQSFRHLQLKQNQLWFPPYPNRGQGGNWCARCNKVVLLPPDNTREDSAETVRANPPVQ